MNLLFYIRLMYALFLVLPHLAMSASPKSEKQNKKGITMETESIYSMRFARPQRDSFIATTTKAKGKITWAAATDKTSTVYWRPHIVLWGKNQLVTTYSDMMLFDQSGKKIWKKPYQPGTPVVAGQGKLYYKNKSLFLDAIDINDKKILDSAPFPGGMSSDVYIEFFFPRKTDFISVLFNPDQHDHQEGEEPKPIRPTLKVLRNRYEITYGDWHHEMESHFHLPPLFIPATNVLALWISHFIKIDTKADKQILEMSLAIESPVEWSVDQNENYYVLANGKNSLAIVGLNSNGKEQWRWIADAVDAKEKNNIEFWQDHPPILSRTGTVYALTNQRLVAVENGKKVWQYSMIAAKDLRSYASVLSDDSILVANGKTLIYLDKIGNKIWSLDLASEILSSPVVDKDGNIFVATATELIRVN